MGRNRQTIQEEKDCVCIIMTVILKPSTFIFNDQTGSVGHDCLFYARRVRWAKNESVSLHTKFH